MKVWRPVRTDRSEVKLPCCFAVSCFVGSVTSPRSGVKLLNKIIPWTGPETETDHTHWISLAAAGICLLKCFCLCFC